MADVLREAQELYRDALDAQSEQRIQIADDLRFSDPSDPQQWDDTIKLQRETDPGGKRPCLVLDQTGQYVANVAGQVEKQPPSIHAIPVGGGADKLAAEQIDGRFRHIEHASRASQHYARVLTSAARVGVGYLIVRPFAVDRALNLQEPRIGSEPDALKVVFDPWSVETDGCDAGFGYVMTALSMRDFERKWPGKEASDFGDLDAPRRDTNRKQVLLAEQWFQKADSVNMIRHYGPDGQQTALPEAQFWKAHKEGLPEQPETPTAYLEKKQTIQWRRMSGADVLEESEYLADYIGIVPVYGYVSFTEGRMKFCGIPRRARSPQQAYNYHKSELMMPGAQLLASKRAIAGMEPIWDRAQTQRRAFLPFNDLDDEGAIAAPSLIKVGSSLIDHAAGAEGALRDIQASIGMYQANLGAPSNETSGVAIEGRKQQGEASTAHFPSHMAASLGQVGQIVLQMDARLADTKRTRPIMGFDGSAGSVTVDPSMKEASRRDAEGVSINPKVGAYGVRVVVGASYSTQRSQTNAAFGEIMRGNPELAPTVAPFWAKTLDFPGSDKFAQAMAAMAPPPVKAILQPEGNDKGPDPAEMAQQLKQCQDALHEAIDHAKAAQDDADQAIASAADAKRLGEVRERELDIESYKATTDRLKVTGANDEQIQAIVRDLINQMLSQPDPLPGDPESHEQPMPGPAPFAAAQEFDDEPLPPIDAPTPGAAASMPTGGEPDPQQPAPDATPIE